MNINLGNKWSLQIEQSGLIAIGVILSIFIGLGFLAYSHGAKWYEIGMIEFFLIYLMMVKMFQTKEMRKYEENNKKQKDDHLKELIRQVINEKKSV